MPTRPSATRIAVTTPARTLADLRRVVSPDERRRAIRQAEFLGLRLGDRDRPHPQRARAASCASAAAIGCRARGQRARRALQGRLPLARATPGRRDRRLRRHRGRQAFEDDRAASSSSSASATACCRFTDTSTIARCGASADVAAGGSETRTRQLRSIRSRRGQARPRTQGEEVFLIDGNTLAYRAFFALPESIATADGRPTNAIYGFASMMAKILIDHSPKAVIVAWDKGWSGRENVYAEYKSQRKSRPDLLQRAVAAPGAARRGVRVPQRLGRGLRGRRRDRHPRPPGDPRPGSR